MIGHLTRARNQVLGPPVYMESLPDAALVQIFNKLPAIPCLLKLSLLCKRWNSILKDPANQDLWRSFKLCCNKVPEEVARGLVRRAGKKLAKLDLILDVQYIVIDDEDFKNYLSVSDVINFLPGGQKKRRHLLGVSPGLASPMDFLDWLTARFSNYGCEGLKSLKIHILFEKKGMFESDYDIDTRDNVFEQASRTLKTFLERCGPTIQYLTLSWSKPELVQNYETENVDDDTRRVKLLGLAATLNLLCIDGRNRALNFLTN
mmetsp:Transcript_11342/g.29930  ORF Transcript_11342/g.29930 Transcript_11342/m.29930 type:complete len:261 (-) Transcript_11342:17-799(-)